MLDRSTDRLSRRGAAVKNLAHSASLHSEVKIAPPNPGIKHLAHHPVDLGRDALVEGREA